MRKRSPPMIWMLYEKPAETDAPHLGPFYLAAIYEATGLSSQTLKNYFIAEKQNPECLRLSDALIMGAHGRTHADRIRNIEAEDRFPACEKSRRIEQGFSRFEIDYL